MADMQPLYVRVSDAPTIFGLSRSTVYEMARLKKITIHKVGGASLLSVAELSALIEGKEERHG